MASIVARQQAVLHGSRLIPIQFPFTAAPVMIQETELPPAPPLWVIDGHWVLFFVNYPEDILRGSVIFPCWWMLQDGSPQGCDGYMLDRHTYSIVRLLLFAFWTFLPALGNCFRMFVQCSLAHNHLMIIAFSSSKPLPCDSSKVCTLPVLLSSVTKRIGRKKESH